MKTEFSIFYFKTSELIMTTLDDLPIELTNIIILSGNINFRKMLVCKKWHQIILNSRIYQRAKRVYVFWQSVNHSVHIFNEKIKLPNNITCQCPSSPGVKCNKFYFSGYSRKISLSFRIFIVSTLNSLSIYTEKHKLGIGPYIEAIVRHDYVKTVCNDEVKLILVNSEIKNEELSQYMVEIIGKLIAEDVIF